MNISDFSQPDALFKGSRPYPSDNVKRQFDVMGGLVCKGALIRYAVTICILFPDIKSKLITSQKKNTLRFIPLISPR